MSNKDRNEYMKQYRKDNPRKIREIEKKYRETHPESQIRKHIVGFERYARFGWLQTKSIKKDFEKLLKDLDKLQSENLKLKETIRKLHNDTLLS